MKTNGVPAIIMLAAGFIDCVIAILTHMSLWNFTRQLLLVLVLFYVIGCVVKMIIDRNFKDMEDDHPPIKIKCKLFLLHISIKSSNIRSKTL